MKWTIVRKATLECLLNQSINFETQKVAFEKLEKANKNLQECCKALRNTNQALLTENVLLKDRVEGWKRQPRHKGKFAKKES